MQKKMFCPYCGLRLSEKFYENRKRLFCNCCNDPIYENPIPAACLVVTDDQGRVLLVGYRVTEFSGNLIAGDDASDAAYFFPANLPEIAFESHLKFIRRLTEVSS